MKKMSAVILTLLMLASLTACSENQNENPIITANGTQSVTNEAPKLDENAAANSNEAAKPEDAANSNEAAKPENAANSDETAKPENTANSNETSKPENTANSNETAKPEETKNPVYTGKHVLPTKDYPDGSYFTTTGETCESHSDCYWDGSCTCKVYEGSIQAIGFARYAYHEVHGKSVGGERVIVEKDITAESAKEMFSSLHEGTYMLVHTANDYQHALVVISADDSGITVYQANYEGKCKVSTPTYSWSEFARRFPHVYNYAV